MIRQLPGDLGRISSLIKRGKKSEECNHYFQAKKLFIDLTPAVVMNPVAPGGVVNL